MAKNRYPPMRNLLVTALIIFFGIQVCTILCQEQFLRYGIYYGTASDVNVRSTDWSQFDLMILNPGTPGNDYKNLEDPAFLILMQTMKDSGVRVLFYQDIGCEKDAGGKYYSQTDREDWIDFKKREINIFMRYADGILLDCIGPEFSGHTYDEQFGRDVQELVDYIHYSGGRVIISNLWTLMDWVETGDLEQIPYKTDYVLFEGAWSVTPNQYSDDWNPLNALTFAKTHDFEVLGLDYGVVKDRDRLMFCYCASRVFAFSGFYYAENFYDTVNILDIPDLGLPLREYTIENGVYTREFQKGTVYVDFQTHRGWIEGEAAEEADISVLLVLAGIGLGYLRIRKKVKS